MVSRLSFQQLLEMSDVPTRNMEIRRGFAAYTELLDITGFEVESLTILLNSTFPRKQIYDLMDTQHAKRTLRNEAHIRKCMIEVQWLHTHNLKYPDIRVSKETFIAGRPPFAISQFLSSANCEPMMGWSHDSAKVNFSKLFSAHFIWQKRVACLALLLCEPPREWQSAFKKLGCSVKAFTNLCVDIRACLPKQYFPQQVDRFLTQICMPYRGEYLSITPIASHALLSDIQQAAATRRGKFTIIEHTRPAAVSELVASLGGRIKVLDYPPTMGKTKSSFSGYWISKLASGHSILNAQALSNPLFKQALNALLYNYMGLTLKERRQQRLSSLRQIRKTLSEWFAPLLELQLAVQDDGLSLPLSIESSFEYQFLNVENESFLSLLSVVQELLHSTLSHSKHLDKYAFHPSLIIPLKGCLKWLLNNVKDEPREQNSVDSDKPQHRYLYIKNIRVFDAHVVA